MRVPRIFVDEALGAGNHINLDQANSHYLRHVLRLESGQEVILFNGRDSQQCAAKIEFAGKRVSAQVITCSIGGKDPSLEIHVVQALGRSDAVDTVMQKATELGAASIRLFNAERTQTPLKPGRLDKKLAHWRSITTSACAQCQRNQLPLIEFYPSLSDCLQQLSGDNCLFLDFDGDRIDQVTAGWPADKPVSILIGPEGGFNDEEIDSIRSAGIHGCSIGPRVLRMETAALSALALIQHYLGDM